MPDLQQVSVLLVDDEPDLLESCARILEDENITCATTTDPLAAVDMIRQLRPGAMVTDFKMPGMDGVELLGAVRGEFPDLPVIMISAYATIEGVVEAVKLGAFDYITKPFSADRFVLTVKRALERRQLQIENDQLREKAREDYLHGNLVGSSPAMAHMRQIISKAAPSAASILIQGETGTGKRVVAQAIHALSGRDNGPFVEVDCAELTKARLLASPLGNKARPEEGDSKSLFEVASGGTLYLKNVDTLSKEAQVELSRILQSKNAARQGKWEWAPVNARVAGSTGVDLRGMVNEGKFRQDLYFLLNVVNIHVPPLRDRASDIPRLCERFLAAIAKREGGAVKTAGRGFLDRLAEYHWPGNVRELAGVMETAWASCAGAELTAEDLPDNIRRQAAIMGLTFKEARAACLRKFEKDFLENLLYTSKGNISQASESAGVARMSLYRMINRNNLTGLVALERETDKAAGAPGEKESEKVDGYEGDSDDA